MFRTIIIVVIIMVKTTTQLMNQLKGYDDLEASINDLPKLNFSIYIKELLFQSGLDNSEVAKRADIERTYFYRIISGEKANTSKDNICKIALALQLDIKTTNHLLSLSNNGELYPKIKRDYVILYALEHHYSVVETNIELAKLNLSLL